MRVIGARSDKHRRLAAEGAYLHGDYPPTAEQVEKQLDVLERYVVDNVATRRHVDTARDELKQEISHQVSGVRADIAQLRDESNERYVDLTNRYADLEKGIQEILSRLP